MRVEPATPGDIRAIADLVDDYARRGMVLPRSIESIRATLADWMVGRDGDHLLACGSLLRYTPHLAEVRSLAVRHEVKGQGWGQALLHALIRHAQSQRIPTLFALTRTTPLFQGVGFAVTDKMFFPEKVWRDCQLCPIQAHCDETAVVMQLAPANLPSSDKEVSDV
jgi:amino-acid N-acetyltransferase